MFNPHTSDLPIVDILDECKNSLNNDNTLIVHAPPGAGKSTLLPLYFLDAEWLNGKKIYMLEPRRLAAKAIASRMAQLLEEPVGKRIGYRIRFESKVSEDTQIEVLTEGILTRMLQSDNALENAGLIIFDEFHERSLFTDLALAFSRESQQVLRPDLRLLIMSATLNIPALSKVLQAPIVSSEGKQYPVEIKYVDRQDLKMLPLLCARTVVEAVRTHEGDILVFLPGEGEIRKCEELLKAEKTPLLIHPLYGRLPISKQQRAILPDKGGRRKVVLATSIAETSLTIQGIKVVIDSGFMRTQVFDPKTGLSRLETVSITKDAADQRAGRAGRLSAGVCYRMWSKGTHQHLEDHRSPEILRADLCSLSLDLAKWGIADAQQLHWLTPPPNAAMYQATEILHNINALENGKITEHGEHIHKLPCHPRIAHMMTIAEEYDLLPLATDLAAVLEERDPLPKEEGIDINKRIEALRQFRAANGKNVKFTRIERVANSYRQLFSIEADNEAVDDFETGLLIANTYPERIAFARPGNNAQFQLANGKYASISHKDDLAHEAWLAVTHLDAKDDRGKIFMASSLNPQDLQDFVKESEVVKWDTKDGGLIASLDVRIGSIVLKSTPLPDPDQSQLNKAICEAVQKEGERLLNFDDNFKNWQHRLLSIRKWNSNEDWPDVTTNSILNSCEHWLSPYLNAIKTPADLKKLNLLDILPFTLLDAVQRESLDKLLPSNITVPSGSTIKLQYEANGNPPILAVRIQELFGLRETPGINNGKNTVLLHLLSPGFKPVQVTKDLKSFWSDTYFEVRKELKRRYPKHHWPDEPQNEAPLRGVKR